MKLVIKILPLKTPSGKTLNGKTSQLQIYSSQTVSRLKSKIFKKEGIPEDRQRLVFEGKRLEDHHKLIDYSIHSACTIHLHHILSPNGGSCSCGGRGCNA